MMTTIQQSEMNLDPRQRVASLGISGNQPPSQQQGEPKENTSTFTDRLKKIIAELKWLKEALATLTWLKAMLASLFGLGLFYCSSPAIKPLSELFPQADAGQQFLWAHPDNAVKAWFDNGCGKPRLTNVFGFFGGSSGLRLQYGLVPTMQDGGWGVHWDNAPRKHFDVSEFDHFSFWVRGASGEEQFEIGLKDTNAREIKIQSKDWIAASALRNGVEITIPLAEFRDVNKQLLNNVSFSFNSLHGSGTICIGSMAFGRKNGRV
jgi:hypothetical protein